MAKKRVFLAIARQFFALEKNSMEAIPPKLAIIKGVC
jgi:hypothetical protein